MKTTNPKFSKIDATVAGIPAAEPVFLLRAEDPSAQAAVAFYAEKVRAANGDQNVISAARASVSAFGAWPVKRAPTFEPEPVTLETVESKDAPIAVKGTQKSKAEKAG